MLVSLLACASAMAAGRGFAVAVLLFACLLLQAAPVSLDLALGAAARLGALADVAGSFETRTRRGRVVGDDRSRQAGFAFAPLRRGRWFGQPSIPPGVISIDVLVL